MIALRPSRAAGLVAALSTAALGASLLALPTGAAYASASATITSVPAVTHIGRTITIAGDGLDDVTSLDLNGVPLTGMSVIDASHVSGTVPSGATTGPIHLSTASGGAATSADVTVAPAPVVTGLSASVGDRLGVISWTSAGTGSPGAVVRDVTGLSGTPTPTSGSPITVVGTTARDTTFDNTTSKTYAVWAQDADGTLSDSPQTTTLNPVAALATDLTLSTNVTSGNYPFTLGLTGNLTRGLAKIPVSNQQLQVWSAVAGSPQTLLRTVQTGANGHYSAVVSPRRTSTYVVKFLGDAFSAPSSSLPRGVSVNGRVTAAWSPSSILRGQTSVLNGRTLPAVASLVLTVQRRSGTSWLTYTHVRTLSDGSYRIGLAPAVGLQVVRVLRPALPGLAAAYSPAVSLRVDPRNMSDGMSGADVLALQRRLASLHYDPGALDGHYSYSLHHAVMAFQKVQHLPVTGIWGNADRLRSTRPISWKVRYPSSGRAVEIDITRQVLVLSEGGVVRRIVDVSTGSGRTYYQDGHANVAHTPRGSFRINRKINGIRISKLGALYKPSYFFQGYAIHGAASVPNYPASHGCVRITNPNADRLFPLLTLGTPVHVYDE